MIPRLTYHRAPDCWPNCHPRYRSTWLQSVYQCVARPAGDDEDGGHLSGVCREEELPIEAGIEAGVDVLSLTADIINRNYLYPVAPNSQGCARLLLVGLFFQDKKKERVLGLCTGNSTNGVGQLASNTLSSY